MDERTYQQRQQEILNSGMEQWAVDLHLRALETERKNALYDEALKIRTQLREEANRRGDETIAAANAYREAVRQQADATRAAERARIDELRASGQITDAQRTEMRKAADDAWNANYEQATAQRNEAVQAGTNYKLSGSDYATQVFNQIRSGEVSPTQQFTLPGSLPPPLERKAPVETEPLRMPELPAPIPAAQAPELTREYYLSKSEVPRAAAEAEADRILQSYNINYPNAQKDIADLAQLYGVELAERQLKGLYAQEGIDLDKAFIDTSTPAGQRFAEDRKIAQQIGVFQPSTPQFEFAPAQQQGLGALQAAPQFNFQTQSPGVQPEFQPQFQRPAPPPLITQAERPTLDQAIQFIESGGMSPQAGARPMQPLTYQDLGSFAPQAQPYFAAPSLGYTSPAAEFAATGVVPMREGGSVAQKAQGMASLGRRGDSMLVHMTPGEVAGLQSLATQMGGSLTINPQTGLPEANFFRKILPIVAAVAAPYLAPFAGALGGAGLAGLLAAGGTMLGGGSFKEGIKTGLLSYGSAALASNAMGSNPLGTGGQESTFNLANTFGGADAAAAGTAGSSPTVSAPSAGGVTSGQVESGIQGVRLSPELANIEATTGAVAPPSAGAVAGASTPSPTGTPPPPAKPGMKILGMEPSTALIAGTMLMGGEQAADEQKRFAELNRQEQAEIERRQALGRASFERSGLGQIPLYTPPRTTVNTAMGGVRPGEGAAPFGFETEEERLRRMGTMTAAGGGLVALARGGMPTFEYGGTTAPTGEPRMVQGAGDGMSDNVPATIEGVQEARLANDEFVVPADVVADIGNGSSSAGAKKLYAMMDRIRQARHGTTEQPPEIDAEKYLPS